MGGIAKPMSWVGDAGLCRQACGQLLFMRLDGGIHLFPLWFQERHWEIVPNLWSSGQNQDPEVEAECTRR